MLNMHVHMSLLEALLGEHRVSRQLATESPEREREREREREITIQAGNKQSILDHADEQISLNSKCSCER